MLMCNEYSRAVLCNHVGETTQCHITLVVLYFKLLQAMQNCIVKNYISSDNAVTETNVNYD